MLDTMASIAESIETRSFIDVESSAAPVPALPEDWDLSWPRSKRRALRARLHKI
ncbi:hypothetical protein ACW0JT_00055 [Arthrobacter sp. SA17]